MEKTEDPGMKSLAREFRSHLICKLFFGRFGAWRMPVPAVDRIANQRMADMGQVNADLMRPAGLEAQSEQRRKCAGFILGAATHFFQHPVMRARGLAVFAQH